MSHLVLEGLAKSYGSTTALTGLDLDVRKGELLTLLGPSGCGKTTALRLVAGFILPSQGRILIDGVDLTRTPPHRRDIGMVFQNYALFPHLTVAANVAFGLEERGLPRTRIRRRVADLLELVRLGHAEDRLPAELSGGQQQRVALARAVAYEPRLLLMDEPLAALDLKLREAMQLEVRRIQRELGITTLYVTHDQTEAMRISDRIAIMNAGRIEQLGTAATIYERPASRFVADFMGRINLFDARVGAVEADTAMLHSALGEMRLPRPDGLAEGAQVAIGIRPDEIEIDPGPRPGVFIASGTVVERQFLGNVVEIRLRMDGGPFLQVEARPGSADVAPGRSVRVGLPVARCKVFPS
jgi:spermidine/putrescine ABC transporter ATP-binding subunit